MTDTNFKANENALTLFVEDAVALSPAPLDYRTFADALPEIVWVTDADGRAIFYNRPWFDYMGLEPGPDLRAKAWAAIHPDDQQPTREKWQDILQTDKSDIRHEFRLRGKDGIYRWFLVRGFPQKDPQTGATLRWIGTSTNIESVKQAMQSLQESEERYRALVDASLQIVWTNTADGKMQAPQPGWVSLTGQTEEEYTGYGWANAVHPEDAPVTIQAWSESVRTRTIFLFEHRVRRKDGVWRLFSIRAVPVLDSDGTIREWVGIHTDITEQRNAAKKQERTLVQLSAVLESATDGIIVTDMQGNILIMNAASLALHQGIAGTASYQHLNDFTETFALLTATGEAIPISDWPLCRALRGEKFTESEYRVQHKETGRETWIAYSGGPANDAEGNLALVVLTLRNVTERKEIEAQRDGLMQRVEEAAERQRRFLREMLFSMSEGRLRLCENATDLPKPLSTEPLYKPVVLDKMSIRTLRHQITAACEAARLPSDREDDLVTAVGEAAMNAVVHAGGGMGSVYADNEHGIVQVWIGDTGTGIKEESLHRATLEKGFTTAGTLGHGFWMMLKTADRVYLLTGVTGTTVVVEQERKAPVPAWMQSFVEAT